MNSLLAKNIKLDHKNHIYKLSYLPDITFSSVTEFIHQFFRKFDQEKIAKKLIKENPKYSEMTVEELIEEWSKGAKKGTIVHNELELFINEGVEPEHELAKCGLEWIKKEQKNPDYIFYSEAIIFSKELAIAGTIDLLIYNKKTETYCLLDWKTNKRIDQKSFRKKKGVLNSTAHLDDCNFSHYSLQLSFYRYILENYYGLKIDNQSIFHLKRNDYQIYDVKYHKEDIVNMLKEKELL